MRCSSCNKFVPNGDPEVEVQEEDFEGELIIGGYIDSSLGHFRRKISDERKLIVKASLEIRVMIPCGECGQELKETNLNFEMEEEHQCDKLPDTKSEQEIEVNGSVDAEPIDDYRTKDRRGKPITNPRYQAHLYGAEVTVTVMCPFCKEEIVFGDREEIESSSMDECG